MTPRPDLSNDAVAVETGDAELSVYAFPRYRGRTFVMTVLGTILSLTPLLYIGKPLNRYFHRGHRLGDIVEPMMYGIPFVLAMAVLANVLFRIRRPRGIKIQLGSVTLDTPDDAISRHTFELNNLDGAALVRQMSSDMVDLQLRRRRGLPVNVFRGYRFNQIGHVVDLINDMVNDDRSFAFEVIVPPPAVRPPPLPQSPSGDL